jgi:hypothetical protein
MRVDDVDGFHAAYPKNARDRRLEAAGSFS